MTRYTVFATTQSQNGCRYRPTIDRLDYCNSLLVNCCNRNLDKLQCSVCRTIRPVSSATRPTAQPQLDHCYGACTGWQSGSGSTSNSPNFVIWLLLSNSQATSLIWSEHQSRLLRSSTQKLLSVPPHNLDTAARRFSVAAPRLRNSLTLNCRTVPPVNTFKIRLKMISLWFGITAL